MLGFLSEISLYLPPWLRAIPIRALHVTSNKSSENKVFAMMVIYVEPRSSEVRKSLMKLSDIHLRVGSKKSQSHTSYTSTCQRNSKQNQTVIIKITKNNNIDAYLHRVNLRSCFRYISHYVFTTGHHQLGSFSLESFISHLNNRNDGCILWKHWILYLTENVSRKGRKEWRLGKLLLFIYVLRRAHEILNRVREKFVGRWSSIYTGEDEN
jgi:hypothetical protein